MGRDKQRTTMNSPTKSNENNEVRMTVSSNVLKDLVDLNDLEAFLCSSFVTPDYTKLQRQLDIVCRWNDNGCKGIVEACTGFGKSFVAIICLWLFNHLRPGTTVLVVLPTDYLRSQWMKNLKKYSLNNIDVKLVTVHTAIKKNWDVDLLVCDEVHRYAANEWIRVFHKVKYEWSLGLSGTLEREDARHYLLFKHVGEVIDVVTYAEAKESSWVTDALIIDYGIKLSAERMAEYREIDEQFSRFSAKMPNGLYLSRKIMEEYKGRKFRIAEINDYMRWLLTKKNIVESHFQRIDDDDIVARSFSNYMKGLAAPEDAATLRGVIEAVFEGRMSGPGGAGPILKAHTEFLGMDGNNPSDTDKVYQYALNFMRFMQKRKGFVYNAVEKIDVVKHICETFYDKTIVTFSESKQMATLIKKEVYNSVMYHSGMKKYQRENVIKEFGDTINVLHAVRALDEGFDLAGIDMGIVVAGSSVVRQSRQRRGRTIRIDMNNPGKRAIMIELYLSGTQDAAWVRKRQPKALRESCEIIRIEDDLAALTAAIRNA